MFRPVATTDRFAGGRKKLGVMPEGRLPGHTFTTFYWNPLCTR